MIEDKEAAIKATEALRDASNIRFSEIEERMSHMEHDVVAQRVENEQLDTTCRRMADDLWVVSRNYKQRQDRVKKLEEAIHWG